MSDPSALFAAAKAHFRAGHLAEARERGERLLAAEPHHGGALHLLGLIAFQSGERAEAARRFSEAAALALARGDADTALQCAVEALTADETPQTRRLFADIAGTLRFSKDDPVVRPLLTRAISEGWGPVAPLAAAAAGLVKAGWRLEDDALLRAALTAAPITDRALEEALTRKRRELLAGATVPEDLAAALARQCFLNGYVFAESDDETAQAAALRARAEAGETAGLPALACYLPLGEVAGAENFTGGAALAAVLQQQRDEPAEEKRLAAALPTLTPIARDADDSEPWPRWNGTPAPETPVTLREYLQNRFPQADLADLPERPALLAAGCGTGEYALHLARILALDSVTAIDLSRAALAYAARKAAEAGIAIRFGQGDILQAAALGQKFGLIECGGVLHQLPDPLAGWSVLLAQLEPNGLMRIAVHSALARAALKGIQDRLARFDATQAGIRAARAWLRTQHDDAVKPILAAPEFFSMGGCRHLLLPGPEHPLTLAQIGAFLRRNGLVLIGFDAPLSLLAAYRARFPNDGAATDLDNWSAFEQENPQSFAAMIQFWVQKRG